MNEYKIGVISDTHGLLRKEAVKALKGVDMIIHAGDIGNDNIIKSLNNIAPVIAVRGNNDKEAWAKKYSKTEVFEVEGVFVYILHDIKDLDLDPKGAGFNVIISGHSHRPSIVEKDAVLFLNPGSAGPRRFKLPVSISILSINNDAAAAKIIELPIK